MAGYLKNILKSFYREEKANLLVETIVVFAAVAMFIVALSPLFKEKVRIMYTEEADDYVFDGEEYDSLIN